MGERRITRSVLDSFFYITDYMDRDQRGTRRSARFGALVPGARCQAPGRAIIFGQAHRRHSQVPGGRAPRGAPGTSHICQVPLPGARWRPSALWPVCELLVCATVLTVLAVLASPTGAAAPAVPAGVHVMHGMHAAHVMRVMHGMHRMHAMHDMHMKPSH